MAVAFFFFLFDIFSSPPVYIISYCKQYVKRFRENILGFFVRSTGRIVVWCKVVKGLSRFPIPFIYIYFFLFPYERLEKPENPQQPETGRQYKKCPDVWTNFSDDRAICLPNLLNRFNIYSDLSSRGDKFSTAN